MKKFDTKALIGLPVGQHINSSVRAQMSRCVPSEDLGKVFAMLASVESLLPIVGSNLYTNLYNATSDLEYPWMGSFYFAAAGFTIIGMSPKARVKFTIKNYNNYKLSTFTE